MIAFEGLGSDVKSHSPAPKSKRGEGHNHERVAGSVRGRRSEYIAYVEQLPLVPSSLVVHPSSRLTLGSPPMTTANRHVPSFAFPVPSTQVGAS